MICSYCEHGKDDYEHEKINASTVAVNVSKKSEKREPLQVYIERSIDSLKRKGSPFNDQLISHLSPQEEGTHQPEWRLLLVNKPQAGTGEIPFVTLS